MRSQWGASRGPKTWENVRVRLTPFAIGGPKTPKAAVGGLAEVEVEVRSLHQRWAHWRPKSGAYRTCQRCESRPKSPEGSHLLFTVHGSRAIGGGVRNSQSLILAIHKTWNNESGVAAISCSCSNSMSVSDTPSLTTLDVFTCNFFTCNLLKFLSGRMSSGPVKQGYQQLGEALEKDRDDSGCMSSDRGSQQLDQARKLAKDCENVISPLDMEGVWERIF